MTAATLQSPAAGRRYRFSVLRILFFSLLMSVLVTAAFYLKYSAVDFFHARLLEQESKTSAWILKQVGFALPWIFMCVFHAATYRRHDRHDSIAVREMFWEVLLVTVFTYFILLPHLQNYSDELYAAAVEAGAKIPQTDGKVDQTFIMLFHEWFVRMAVPFAALLIFYSARARRERLHPETEAAEPLMTCAEYDALHNNSDTSTDGEIAPQEVEESAETPSETVNTPDTEEDDHE